MIDLYEEEVDLREVIASGLRLIGPRARDGMIDLQTDYDEPLSMVTADTRRLKQILINLLSNAVKFTPAGGSVTVEAWARPGLGAGRSEEHTSELQSLMRISYGVFCLKKTRKTH